MKVGIISFENWKERCLLVAGGVIVPYPTLKDFAPNKRMAMKRYGLHIDIVDLNKVCVVNPYSSRVCEKGTKSCNIKHGD